MLRLHSFSRIFVRHNTKNSFIRIKTEVFDKFVAQKPDEIKWEPIRNSLIKNEITVNQTNVDSIILSKCFNGAHLEIALSYINFLKSNSLKINDATIAKIIRLYYINYKKREGDGFKLSEEDENEIIKWCDLIDQKNDIVDASIAENVIHGLSITRDWLKAFKYLDYIRELDKVPSESTYSCLLVKAIKEDRDDVVWSMLQEMTAKNILPKMYVFIEWFEHYKNVPKQIETMLKFVSDNSLLLQESEIHKIEESLKKIFNVALVTINRTGRCPSCTQKLPGVKLLPNEFSKLASTFLDEIFIKNDVFLKTNPEEIKKFKEFVDKTAPYDSVVDGLNVAYSQGNGLSPKVYAKILCQVVKYFENKSQKCLVIGKNYMKSWPRKEMSYIRENSLIFLTEDLSYDDLFLIYAALKSGPKTNIFSRDLLRQHSHLLNNHLRQVFRRWQQEHQFQLITAKGQNKIIVKEPILFELRAHKVGSIWHLPFTNGNQRLATQTFNLPTSWLCLKER